MTGSDLHFKRLATVLKIECRETMEWAGCDHLGESDSKDSKVVGIDSGKI